MNKTNKTNKTNKYTDKIKEQHKELKKYINDTIEKALDNRVKDFAKNTEQLKNKVKKINDTNELLKTLIYEIRDTHTDLIELTRTLSTAGAHQMADSDTLLTYNAAIMHILQITGINVIKMNGNVSNIGADISDINNIGINTYG